MKSFKSTLALAFLCFPILLFAQKGTIRGQVIDGENGEPLFAANAVIKGTQIGTTTDFDGYYELQADPGTYQLEISFIGMSSLVVTDIVVKAGEVTVVEAVTLEPASNQLAEVVVTSEAVRNSEAALVTVKRKSTNLIDGVSAAKLRKTGDSDAGDAAKRVTGVSVEGGKYVYVRGLGDRYTKTMLNGVDIPGLDPDKNSIQIDIFPTNLISNLTVLKSGLAELPADFTGGVVNIETQEFPTDRILDVSVGVGFNPAMHFNSDYISYEGGSTDFLGFDDGTRAIPRADGSGPLPFFDDEEAVDFNKNFSRTLGAEQNTSFTDYSLGISMGNQYSLESGNKLGYIFSLTYDNSRVFYDDIEYGEWQRDRDPEDYQLIEATTQKGKLAEQNVLLGGLAGFTYKTLMSKYKFTAMHLQNGTSRSAQLSIDAKDGAAQVSDYYAFSNNLEYNQRGLTNLLLAGEHYLDGGDWEINWKVSPTLSSLADPDIRKTAFSIDRGDSTFDPGEGGLPSRIWRSLSEVNLVSKVDVIRAHTLMGDDAKFKFGMSHVFKYRDYSIYRYNLNERTSNQTGSIQFSGDPNAVLTDPNLYQYNSNVGQYLGLYYNPELLDGQTNPNEYQSNVNNFGFYASEEFKPLESLKAVIGLRAELFQQRHTGRDQVAAQNPNDPTGNTLNNDVVLDALDLFPSANLIYALNDNMNLRASYYRSIARPSFKELSFAQILDPVSNRTFNGGLFQYNDWNGQLESTRINNFDLRLERFLDGADIISISAFYKAFDSPIELVRIPVALRDFQPRNVGNGTLIGAEFELRKNLSFIRESLKNIAFSGNFTYTYSRIDMTDAEFNARKTYEKVGQTIERTRQMAGQAPYIINAGFSYDNTDKGISAGVFYNVKGRTLEIVGGNLAPDVYTEPFHSLNLTFNKTFGEEGRSSLNIKVSNLLNDVRESLYQAYDANAQVFNRLQPGTAFSIGYTYSFY
ncbi:TonB-dependent receptor domain-containing protein [Croceimicrobium sp.]|uniref:TonB-dependent receptor n=1 Tax=Croceimicrobium sp. TaxID=2828340 RepID=UPI003BAA0EB5